MLDFDFLQCSLRVLIMMHLIYSCITPVELKKCHLILAEATVSRSPRCYIPSFVKNRPVGSEEEDFLRFFTRDVESCQIRHSEVRIRYPDTSEGSHRIYETMFA